MIPTAAINQWASKAPWPTSLQIEQDLLLSRLIAEIANHEYLGEFLAFRGDTCFNKLHLGAALRYSEDLDYVLTRPEPLKRYFDSVREIAEPMGFQIRWETGDPVTKLYLLASPTDTVGRIRIKIEINKSEIAPFRPLISLPYKVDSVWWVGEAQVRTFVVEELLGTKVRALHQRRKGRDLFDLWYGITRLTSNDDVVMGAFHHYMGDRAFSFAQFEDTFDQKLNSAEFRSDLHALLTITPVEYDMDRAADLVKARLGPYLRNFDSRRAASR